MQQLNANRSGWDEIDVDIDRRTEISGQVDILGSGLTRCDKFCANFLRNLGALNTLCLTTYSVN